MPSSPNRRRIEIPEEVYDMLDREARWLHIPVTALATMLCREGVERLQQRFSPATLIAQEGSPSPTLAELQRRAVDRLAAGDSNGNP